MTLRSLAVSTFVVASLAGCSLTAGLTGGTSTGSGPRTAPTGSSGGSPANRGGSISQEQADAEMRERDRPRPGYTDCSNRAEYMRIHGGSCDPKEPTIVGLTIDDAKKKILAHTPGVQVKVVEQYEFDKDCAAGHVCRIEPHLWYLGSDRFINVITNRTLDLGPPAE